MDIKDYRIVGGDTRFTITADTRSRNPQYSIPENETYVLFDVDDVNTGNTIPYEDILSNY